jgi:methyl-accepting chemotaxis protein
LQRVTDIIGEISAAAAEQSQGIGQVNSAVAHLDQMTQQNAALVEESATAAESLGEQARRLAAAVSIFHGAAGMPAAAARPAARALPAQAGPAAPTHIASATIERARARARASLPAPAARVGTPSPKTPSAAAPREARRRTAADAGRPATLAPAARPAPAPAPHPASKPAADAAPPAPPAPPADDGDWETF